MAFLELKLPPGVHGNGTRYQSRGRWWRANLIRFPEGTVRPVGGWIQHSSSAVTGKARALLTWKDNSNSAWIAIGTESGLYAMSRSGTLFNITPAGFTTGRANATVGGGYGLGLYGSDAYGTSRPDTAEIQDATVWTLDTWGERLVGMNADDATPYEWNLNTSGDAAAISGAPDGRALVVTSERILMILGTDNPRRIEWSDAEDNTSWAPGPTSQAGSTDLQTAGRLMTGKRLSGEVGVWTDLDFWSASFDPTLKYVFKRQGSDCGAVSQQAVAVIDAQAVWMSQNSFWVYNGFVRPLECEVADRVFPNLNRNQASKVHAVHNSSFGEVWWFYPSDASNEIDHYVAWNYRENHWTEGALIRLSGADRGVFLYPLMVGDDGIVYEHETGWSYEGADAPSAEGGPIQLGAGDSVAHALRLIGDESAAGSVQVSFLTRFYPNGEETTYGPYTLTANPPTDVRFTAREIDLRIEGVTPTDWRFGVPRLDLKAGGRR